MFMQEPWMAINACLGLVTAIITGGLKLILYTSSKDNSLQRKLSTFDDLSQELSSWKKDSLS